MSHNSNTHHESLKENKTNNVKSNNVKFYEQSRSVTSNKNEIQNLIYEKIDNQNMTLLDKQYQKHLSEMIS